MFENIILSLKFIFYYLIWNSAFGLIARVQMIYDLSNNIILNGLAIIGITSFSFYQGFKHVILNSESKRNQLLIISSIEVLIITYLLLSFFNIETITIIYTIIIIIFNLIAYLYYLLKIDKY
ncbi:MAG: hypothetical protein PHI22_03730 [Bacilli bacterium]|nr:hypothetical protein [Bacilli bacterium]MDD4298628.1 hypothetical protein [Bacilli bacterium]MDD4644216.1 hypothetical protein [Bacilli bacterium]